MKLASWQYCGSESSENAVQGNVDWSNFSKFTLTFDPLSQAKDEFYQVSASATPSDTLIVAKLRYFLYCWQRIKNDQRELIPEAIDKVQTALSILRPKM